MFDAYVSLTIACAFIELRKLILPLEWQPHQAHFRDRHRNGRIILDNPPSNHQLACSTDRCAFFDP